MTHEARTLLAARPPSCAPAPPALEIAQGRYVARFARTAREIDAALRLRFAVFNRELGEGLGESLATGRDEDPYDPYCHHLVVVDTDDGRTVGTYRMQTAAMASRGRGFYTASEFDLAALPAPLLDRAVELGRACIAREHRNTRVLLLLWRGIAAYARAAGARYLFGCCSLTSREPRDGLLLLERLVARDAMHDGLRARARAEHRCLATLPREGGAPVAVPRLFDMYLALGARVCSEPAIDRAFGTIDFLVLFDLATMRERDRRRFLPADHDHRRAVPAARGAERT